MWRAWSVSSVVAVMALGQMRGPTATLEKVPFDQWLRSRDDANMRWSLRVSPAALGEYQRLGVFVRSDVAAEEFVGARTEAKSSYSCRFGILESREYRTRQTLFPSKKQNLAELADVRFIEQVCVKPGDYDVAAAVYDAESKEHSLRRTRIRIPDLPHDALSGSWHDVPNVEFSHCGPSDSALLSLPVQTKKPVHVEVVMNQTVNRNAKPGSARVQMTPMIERLEVISEMKIRNGSLNVTLLDLERRLATFSGQVGFEPIRRQIDAALREANPYMVDRALGR